MIQINAYLNFAGNCEEAFNFYQSVLGGSFGMVGRYKDMPPSENGHANQMDGEKIMHMSLQINEHTVLMGSDIGGEWALRMIAGNNVQLSINADSEEAAKRIFDGLSAGGQATMPLEKTFWGALFGMFTDKFGIHWMVNYDYGQKS